MTGEVVAVIKALVAIKQGDKLCMACGAPLGHWPGSVMVAAPFAAPIDVATVGGVCHGCERRGATFVRERCIAQFRESAAAPDAREIAMGRA
jgi:hypothetical protein